MMALAAFAAAGPTCTHLRPRHDRAALAAALGACRPVQARLPGIPYASWSSRPLPVASLPALRRLSLLASVAAERDPSPANQAALAFLRLVSGHAARAIELGQQALAGGPQPPDAVLLTDLGAAYLALASAEDPILYARALKVLNQALEARPRLLAARFDRALALEGLTLDRQARRAWQDYLAADARSGWAQEARAHLRTLAAPTEEQVWGSRLPALSAAAAARRQGEVDAIVNGSRQAARLHAEGRLGAWSAAAIAGDNAAAGAALATAREIGQSLARSGGDRLLRDAVERIDSARRSAAAPMDDLLAGHAAYAAAVRAMPASDLERAEPLLRQARRRLASAGSPFAFWAAFQLAECAYLRTEQAAALRLLDETERSAETAGYAVLAARCHWLRGTILLFAGLPGEAFAQHQAALSLFERCRESANLTAVHTLLAGDLGAVGDERAAWSHRYMALVGLRRIEDPMRLRATLGEAAVAMLKGGEADAALELQNELVQQMTATATPVHLAAALRGRARIEDELHRTDAALRDLAAARAEIARIPDPQAREVAAGEAFAAEGEIRGRQDSAAGLAALDQALAVFQRGHLRLLLPGLFLDRARLFELRGNLSLAGASAGQGIVEAERQRAAIDLAHRPLYFAQVRGLYSTMVRLSARRGDAATALAYAESGRTRSLLDLLAGSPGRPPAAQRPAAPSSHGGPPDLPGAVPPGVTIVEFEQGERSLWIWVVTRGRLTMREERVTAAQMRNACLRFVALAQRTDGRGGEADRAFAAAARRLDDLLFSEVRGLLPPMTELVLIPDPAFGQLPFAALVDGESGRFLGELWTLVTAPSARVFLRSWRRARTLAGLEHPGALVAGGSSFRRDLFPALASLPEAEGEARAVAASFPSARLLLGPGATKRAFLTAAVHCGVVHFAGHSRISEDNPQLSFLLMAPGSATGDTGALYAHEVARLHFNLTRLVVLSSCGSAGGPSSGGERPAGIAGAFLAAGVPTVLGSLWNVEDHATRVLFERFYHRLSAGADPASALRAAGADLRAGGIPALRAPSAWAGFEIIGGNGPIHPDRS